MRFFTSGVIALIGLGCVDVGAIPAPTPEPLQWRAPAEPSHPPVPSPRAMATLGQQTILLGGHSGDETWAWNGRTWTQLHPATSPPGRYDHAMATLGNKVVLFGGGVANGPLNDTWEWDGTTWTLLKPPSSPPARQGHAMATLGNKVVLFGGFSGSGESFKLHNDTWTWDGTTWTLLTLPSSPPARQGHAMAALGSKVILFGGSGQSGGLNDTWEWDGVTWIQATPLGGPSARFRHAMATLGDKVVLFGGAEFSSDRQLSVVNDMWQWDGKAWMPICTASCANESPTPRLGHAMTSRAGSILLFGSDAGPGGPRIINATEDTWEWNGDRWFQRLLPPVGLGDSPAALPAVIADRHVAMAALGDKAVLWGDVVGTWEWDGTVWTDRGPTTSPPKRFGHAMAALGDKAVLFGGLDLATSSFAVETWQWDGTTWTRLDPPTSPPWRTGHAMATLGNKVVLFGGGDDGFATLADTWEWDGTTWTKRTPPVSPPARYEHAMATVGNEVVLFGGVGESGELLDDTWTWDRATWTRLAPASPPAARRAHAMATLNNRVVLFGGFELGSFASGASAHDTWAFNGGEWTQVLPTTYPPERGNHAMAAVAGEIVLVGGSDDRQTWLLGAPSR